MGLKENGLYAIYNKKEYKCDIENQNKVSIYSESLDEGFSEFMGVYYKEVPKNECVRIYKKTLCFLYNNDSFLIRDEDNVNGKVLLETGTRSYDLTELGFKRVLNDTFQKWVSKTEGKEYWAYTEY